MNLSLVTLPFDIWQGLATWGHCWRDSQAIAVSRECSILTQAPSVSNSKPTNTEWCVHHRSRWSCNRTEWIVTNRSISNLFWNLCRTMLHKVKTHHLKRGISGTCSTAGSGCRASIIIRCPASFLLEARFLNQDLLNFNITPYLLTVRGAWGALRKVLLYYFHTTGTDYHPSWKKEDTIACSPCSLTIWMTESLVFNSSWGGLLG